MKSVSLLLLTYSLFFIACSEPRVQVTTKKESITISDTIHQSDTLSEIDKLASRLITNANVVSMLTEYGNNNLETKVLMKTSFGDMKIKLYQETHLHRANFIMLTKKKYFDSTKFYRVINKFMIQGGNSDDGTITNKMAQIGAYRIPNEINPNFGHFRGTIAMAVSPEEQQFEKKSSAFNFYIIQGQDLNESYLKVVEERGVNISPKNRERYLKEGGAPHLDGNYTVFGEVYDGLSVIDKIARVKTDESDWPINPVYIKSVEIIK